MDWGSTANQSFLAGPLKTQLLRVVPHRRPMSAKPQNTIVGAFRVFLHPNNYLGGGRQIGQHRSFNHVRQKPRANNRRGQLPWEGVGCSPPEAASRQLQELFPPTQPSHCEAAWECHRERQQGRQDREAPGRGEGTSRAAHGRFTAVPGKMCRPWLCGKAEAGADAPPSPNKRHFFVKENSFGAGGATENRCPDGA